MGWDRIIADYTQMIKEASKPQFKVIPRDYDMAAEEYN